MCEFSLSRSRSQWDIHGALCCMPATAVRAILGFCYTLGEEYG